MEELKNHGASYSYAEMSAFQQEMRDLWQTRQDEQLSEVIRLCSTLQKMIEHEIWVKSRTATAEEAEQFVHLIPDHIIMSLSKALIHDGKPRALLSTPAFMARVAAITAAPDHIEPV